MQEKGLSVRVAAVTSGLCRHDWSCCLFQCLYPCVATAARTTAQTRQASFAIANTRPSHRRPFDRREMTRGLGSRVNPQWHLKCPRALERHDGEALRHPTHTYSTPGPAVPFAAICRRAPCVSPNVMVKLGGFQGELRARRGRCGSSF